MFCVQYHIVVMRCRRRLQLIAASLLPIALRAAMSLSLRQHLLRGGKSYGPVCMSDSPVVVEMLAHAGYGHMVIDHEHSPTDSSSGQALLQAIDAARASTAPIIRVDSHSPSYLKKILDSMRLPGGVLVPMVEDAATAQKVVAATRYPPAGIRGCAYPFVRASSYGSNPNYLQQCEDDLLVMVQVETERGVESIQEISEVDGIDGIFLGPFDLSASIGKVGQFDNPQVQSLIKKAEDAVLQSGCFLAGFKSGGRALEAMFNEDGYSLVCGSVDLGLLRDAAQEDAQMANNILNKNR